MPPSSHLRAGSLQASHINKYLWLWVMPPKSTSEIFIISGKSTRFFSCSLPRRPAPLENVFLVLRRAWRFERRFCSGGLCFLTGGSGVFWCWLWIISCNDGSAWHVCLDSMPSPLSADQTELSYWLESETGISQNRKGGAASNRKERKRN